MNSLSLKKKMKIEAVLDAKVFLGILLGAFQYINVPGYVKLKIQDRLNIKTMQEAVNSLFLGRLFLDQDWCRLLYLDFRPLYETDIRFKMLWTLMNILSILLSQPM
jgi:hypothetical protein